MRLFRSQNKLGVLFESLVLVVAVVLIGSFLSRAWAQRKPAGYEQILPRGKISAIDAPVYVEAADAKIEEDSMVLGVVIDEQPVAYSLNLLNRHEVVNDSIGKTNFAAVW